MKNLLMSFAALLVALPAVADGSGQPYRDGDRVVFFGDSITRGAGYPETVSLYYETRFPGRDIRFINAGWSGASATQAFLMLDEDIVSNRPTVVSLMYGMNDCGWTSRLRTGLTAADWKRFEQSETRYAELMPKLVADIRRKAGNPRIQYVTPSPYDQSAFHEGVQGACVANDALVRMSEAVRGWAKADGADCIDLQAGLAKINAREQALDPTFSAQRLDDGSLDRVHPGSFGYLLFAYFWLKEQQAPAVVSALAIDAARGMATGTENAEVAELVASPSGVSFTATEKALPYPLEGRAREAAHLVPFMEDLNRETLSVGGLEPGGYDVVIDGVFIGSWSAGELAAGVELAGRTNTPQYVQARAVWAENRKMWAETRSYRTIVTRRCWLREHYHVDSDDLDAVRRHIADLEARKKTGYDHDQAVFYLKNVSRKDEILANIERSRERIRALAQPVAHRWQIKPCGADRVGN